MASHAAAYGNGKKSDHPCSALAGHRFHDQAGNVFRGRVIDEEILEQIRAGHLATGIGLAQRTPVTIGIGHTVNFRSVRSEPHLVRLDLAGQAHGQQGAAMKGTVKSNHPLTAGVMTGRLDGIFHCLGPAVGQHGHLLEVTGSQSAKLFHHFKIGFVHNYMETGVDQFFGLILDGSHHLGVAMAHVLYADAAGKINDFVPFHVPDNSALGRSREKRGDVEHTLGYILAP